jgi:thiol-disulfide isomerase/thioredoxin
LKKANFLKPIRHLVDHESMRAMGDNDSIWKAPFVVLGVLAVIAIIYYRNPPTTFAADGMDPNWDAAVRHSKDYNLPTVVLFTANWCPVCRELHANVLARGDVQNELHEHYGFCVVDLSNPSPEVAQHAQKFGVSGIPLMIRYDANGKETSRVNYLPPEQMIDWLKAGE